MVAIPAAASHAPDWRYDIEHFTYDQTKDQYICPQGYTLNTNGKWHNKDRTASSVKVKHYKSVKCTGCPAFSQCTKNKKGRLIERSQYQSNIDNNAKRIAQNKETYKRRQAIVEHPFGIIKRQWDFYFVMTKKSTRRATTDVGLIFCAFNLRRIFNMLDKNVLKAHLKASHLIFDLFQSLFKAKSDLLFYTPKYQNTKAQLKITT